MKHSKRIISLLLVLLMMVAAVPNAGAAGASKNVTPGGNTNLTFTYDNVFGLDGTFSLVDPDGIVESWRCTGFSNNFQGSKTDTSCFTYATTAGKLTVTVYVKLKASAQPGQTATVIFDYAACIDELGTMTDYKKDSATVVTIQKTTPVEPTPDPPVQTPMDYSALERQIAIANGLNQGDYTTDTWQTLSSALSKANGALSSKDQSVVDGAAKALADAIAALVRMDYTALEAALQLVSSFLDTQDVGDLWMRLCDAVTRGKALIGSGDQTAVDAVTQEIQTLLEELKTAIVENKTPEIVIQEVPVEVPPSDDFCNISMHRVWPVLFFASLGLNIALVVLLVMVLARKKRKTDNTPLVDYDIDEDIE